MLYFYGKYYNMHKNNKLNKVINVIFYYILYYYVFFLRSDIAYTTRRHKDIVFTRLLTCTYILL